MNRGPEARGIKVGPCFPADDENALPLLRNTHLRRLDLAVRKLIADLLELLANHVKQERIRFGYTGFHGKKTSDIFADDKPGLHELCGTDELAEHLIPRIRRLLFACMAHSLTVMDDSILYAVAIIYLNFEVIYNLFSNLSRLNIRWENQT